MSSSRTNQYHPYPGGDPSATADADASAVAAALALQLQGQAQGQLEAQGQGQGQGQNQSQDQHSSSDNLNLNGNGSLNGNGNLNGNLNANGNINESVNDNHNTNTNTSDTTVHVDVGVGIDALPTDNDFADLDLSHTNFDNMFITDTGSINFDPGNDVDFSHIFDGAFNGAGINTGFAINQVADLVDNDQLSHVSQDNSGSVTLDASGGDAGAGDGIASGADGWDSWFSNHGGGGAHAGDDLGGSSAASAAANLTSTAFTQDIVLGANLQQNTFDATVINGTYTHTTISGDSE